MKYRFQDSDKVEGVRTRIKITDGDGYQGYKIWLRKHGYPLELMHMGVDEYVEKHMKEITRKSDQWNGIHTIMQYTPTVEDLVIDHVESYPGGEWLNNTLPDIIKMVLDANAEPYIEEPIELNEEQKQAIREFVGQ